MRIPTTVIGECQIPADVPRGLPCDTPATAPTPCGDHPNGLAEPAEKAYAHVLAQCLGEPLLEGNQTDFLCNSATANESLLNAIDLANDHVNMDAAVLRFTHIAPELLACLIKARRRGVRVQMHATTTDLLELRGELARLNGAGAVISSCLPARLLENWCAQRLPIFQRQLVVVDGCVGWLGPGVRLNGGGGPNDLHVQVRGPVVQRLQRLFLESWMHSRPGVASKGPAHFPAAAQFGSQRLGLLASSSASAEQKPCQALHDAIRIASQSIAVTLMPTMVSSGLVQALIAAASRGVDVSVLLPATQNLPFLWRVSAQKFLQANVKVFQATGAHSQACVCVVDGVWSSYALCSGIGQHGSLLGHHAELIFLDRDCGQFLNNALQADLSQSVQVTLEAGSVKFD